MNKKCIVLVLDGFGMQATDDVATARPGDENASTLGSILKQFPTLKLKNLEALGLMNAFGKESFAMKFSEKANYSIAALMHFGADTYAGHQEIMGTLPLRPTIQPFQEVIDEVHKKLVDHGHTVKVMGSGGLHYLLVDGCVCVADNIDADFGQAYNVTAPLDTIAFDHVLAIGRIVRSVAKVSRVIPFGGTGTTIADILAAEERHQGKYIGIHAVKSKSYQKGYQVLHLGYGVNEEVQLPALLNKKNVPVSLFGKVADIVANPHGKSVSCVNTEQVMDLTIEEVKAMPFGFLCTNVQETDLAGHSQDPLWYKTLLERVDAKLDVLLPLLNEEDLLIIMADHGNDPLIGHNKHTRENVPVLIFKKGVQGRVIPKRKSLSDIGATVCEFFDCELPENGASFYRELL